MTIFLPLLLEELSKRGIEGLVTIRQNRLENAAVPSKQRRKLKRGSYDCSTDTRVNAVVFWHDTAIATCGSNYAGAAPESFIKRRSKAEKKKTNVLMAHALMLRNQKLGGVDLFYQFVATIPSKSDGSRFLHAASTLGCCTRKFTAKYPNACFYEENNRHNACFIRATKIAKLATCLASVGILTFK